MIKLIIFDAGDILYYCKKECAEKVIKRFLDRYGISFEKSEKIWKVLKKKAEVGKLSLNEANLRWLTKLGLNQNSLRRWEKFDKEMLKRCCKKAPWVNYVLRKLSRRYLIAVLSDSIENSREKRKRMDLIGIETNLIKKIYTSNELKSKKPCPKTYLTVIKDFKLDVDECVFVGHSKDEIDGAKKLGILTVSLGAKGDYNIKSLRELPKIIKVIEKRTGHLLQKT